MLSAMTFVGHSHLCTMGTPMSHGITQFYLSPDKDDLPTIIPAEAGSRCINPRGIKGSFGMTMLVQIYCSKILHGDKSAAAGNSTRGRPRTPNCKHSTLHTVLPLYWYLSSFWTKRKVGC